jgi:hypothetical protein
MKVVKTTFEKEQQEKDEAFLRMTAIERLDYARRNRQKMRKADRPTSFKGMRVTVTRLNESL